MKEPSYYADKAEGYVDASRRASTSKIAKRGLIRAQVYAILALAATQDKETDDA